MSAFKTWLGHLVRLFILATLTLPAHAQIDTNHNGMSDVWERHFNNGNLFDPGNPAHHPDADPDGDGWTNLQESIAGTDPFSGNPPEGMVATLITHLKDQEEAPSPEYPEGRNIDLAIISWDTLPGKQYLLKASPDLSAESWIAVDLPYVGDGQPAAISITLTDFEGKSPNRLFWRVHVEDPKTDSDNDGLTDHEEYLLGSNPYNADTSDDGVPDGWLVVHGYNPNDNHENTLFGDSDLSVASAFAQGVQAHPNATLDDLDGDGIPNDLDAHPQDHQINWERTDVSGYVLIDLVWPGNPGNLSSVVDFNDAGHILLRNAVWINGQWHSIQHQDLSGTEEIWGHQYTYQSLYNEGYRLTPTGGIIQWGEWDAYGGPGDIENQGHVGFMPYDADTSSHGSYLSTFSTLGPFINNQTASIRPFGGDALGRIYVVKTPAGANDEILILDDSLEQTGLLSLPPQLRPNWIDSRVTRSGWVAANALATSQSQNHQTLIWDPDGNTVGSAYGHLPYYFQDIAELPNDNIALTYSQPVVGDQVLLLDPYTGSFRDSENLSGKKILAFAGNGTAITTDDKIWLNGTLVPIAERSPSYKNSLDDGWSLQPLHGNAHGVFLIGAAKGDEVEVKLGLRLQVNDNLPATGVDNFSLSANPEDVGYTKDVWIMAPQQGSNFVNENLTMFDIAGPDGTEVTIHSTNATPAPAAVEIDLEKVKNAGKDWKGYDVTWRGGAGTGINDDAQLAISIDALPKQYPINVSVKTMKHRTVKLSVHPVRARPEFRDVPLPDELQLRQWLNQVFGYQVNAWFEIDYKDQVDYEYIVPDTMIAPVLTRLLQMTRSEEMQDDAQDIRLFVIDHCSMIVALPGDPDLYGYAFIEDQDRAAVVNASKGYDLTFPPRPAQKLIETIAHEIGHILVGEGHPDEGGGKAPLIGTDQSMRLMSTLAVQKPGAKLLVKTEWDWAEKWLIEYPDKRGNANNN